MTRYVYVLPAGRLRWEVRIVDINRVTESPRIFYRRKAHATVGAGYKTQSSFGGDSPRRRG